MSRKHWSDPVLMSGDCGCTVPSLFCISFEYRYGLTGTPTSEQVGGILVRDGLGKPEESRES